VVNQKEDQMTDEQTDDQLDVELPQAEVEPEVEAPEPEEQTKLTFDQVVEQVARGEWGSGQGRRMRLSEAGFDHHAIQKALVRRTNHLE
jgi:hypothetical protein